MVTAVLAHVSYFITHPHKDLCTRRASLSRTFRRRVLSAPEPDVWRALSACASVHAHLHDPRAAAVEVLTDAQALAEIHSVEHALALDWQRRAHAAREVAAAEEAELAACDVHIETLRRGQVCWILLREATAHAHLERRAEKLSHVGDAVRAEHLEAVVPWQLGEGDAPAWSKAVRSRRLWRRLAPTSTYATRARLSGLEDRPTSNAHGGPRGSTAPGVPLPPRSADPPARAPLVATAAHAVPRPRPSAAAPPLARRLRARATAGAPGLATTRCHPRRRCGDLQ
eukprot:scaffold59283_cov62-Phaeocystis_antarctica.AAC.5